MSWILQEKGKFGSLIYLVSNKKEEDPRSSSSFVISSDKTFYSRRGLGSSFAKATDDRSFNRACPL